jgi:TolB-like protein
MGFYVKKHSGFLIAALAAGTLLAALNACTVMSNMTGALSEVSTANVRSTDELAGANGVLGSKHLVREFQKYSIFHKHDYKVIVTTFVDLNDFNKTSDFGRLLSENVMSELIKSGYKVVEIRESRSVQIIKDVGELFLTRGAMPERGFKKEVIPKNYKEEYIGSLLIVGTYQAGASVVTINARVINPETSDILTVASYQLARTGFVDELLATETDTSGGVLPKVEVRKGQ